MEKGKKDCGEGRIIKSTIPLENMTYDTWVIPDLIFFFARAFAARHSRVLFNCDWKEK